MAEKINKIRQAKEDYTPEKYARASVFNALGILDELYLSIIEVFFKEYGIDLRNDLLEYIEEDLGEKEFNSA